MNKTYLKSMQKYSKSYKYHKTETETFPKNYIANWLRRNERGLPSHLHRDLWVLKYKFIDLIHYSFGEGPSGCFISDYNCCMIIKITKYY